MAKYTIELRNVCKYYTRQEVENWFKSYNIEDYLTPKQIEVVNKAGLWNKDKLAKKIVDHYYMREIGFETPYLFQHYVKITMEEIMEEKLPLIYSSSIEYDPLINVDFTETFKRNENGKQTQDLKTKINGENKSETSGNSKSSSNSNSSGLSVTSDTPQTELIKEEVLKGKYASNTSANESENNIKDETNTSSNIKNTENTTNKGDNIITSNNTEDYTKTMRGNSGVSATAQKMVEQFRQNIIAIDRDIINELNVLFMGIY